MTGRSASPAAVILAAGAAYRYGSLKQLAPVGPGGEAVLDYSAWSALRAGFDPIVLVIRTEQEPLFRRHLDEIWGEGVVAEAAGEGRFVLAHQSPPPPPRRRPWGTAHAAAAALPAVAGRPVAIANGDDLYGNEAWHRVARWLERAAERGADEGPRGCLQSYRLEDTLSFAGGVSRGLCRATTSGLVTELAEILELRPAQGRAVGRYGDGRSITLELDDPVSMNLWGLTDRALPLLAAAVDRFVEVETGLSPGPEGDERELHLIAVLEALRQGGRLDLELLPPGPDRWCGMTWADDHPRVRTQLEGEIDRGTYPRNLSIPLP